MNALRREQGMGIVEIVVALAIMFFVLTAMLTTLGVATNLSNQARYTSVATALAEEQMEEARMVDYSTLGVAGAPSDEPSGTLPAQETTTVSNVTFTIDRDIQWVDDPVDGEEGTGDSAPHDYKRMEITITWDSVASQGTLVVASNFREPDEQGIPPNVEFTSIVPSSNAIIYQPGAPSAPAGSSAAVRHDNGAIAYWRAKADDLADPNGGIASVTFFFNGDVMRRFGYASPDDVCSFVPDPSEDRRDPAAMPAAPGFSINTLATDASGTAIYAEGKHEIRVETWDDSGQRDFRSRQVIIDNYPPNTPATCVASPTATDEGRHQSMTVRWAESMDGNVPATSYRVYRNPYNGYGGSYYLTGVTSSNSLTTSTAYNDDIAVGAPPYPFGSIKVWDFYVQAVSPAGWVSGARYSGGYAANGPGLAGTIYEPSANRRDVKVIWGDRSWNVASTAVYDIAYSQNLPGGAPLNMFTNPGAGTTVIQNVCGSSGSGTYAPPTFATVTTSTATWRTTWDASDPANPHFQWESKVQWFKNADNPYSYMQVRARLSGGYYTGTVYSNVIGAKDSSLGDYPDNPYTYF